jgi:membrane-bound lytic murein transglycosylase D
MRTLVSTALILSLYASLPTSGHASPGFASNVALRAPSGVRTTTHGPFAVPSRMRGRVDFWKDVFAKYGKYQVVIHHREFPQITFGVMDFRAEALTMSSTELAKHREATEKRTVAEIKAQLTELANGSEPRTAFQQKVVSAMSWLPGGREKYRRVVELDLVRTQTGIRERFGEAIKRAWRYLPVMEQIFVSEYGLPKELTRLPFIESSFDYTAYSSVGAAGMWQFMGRTAKSHGMVVGKIVDERRDPIKSTRAAAEYLRSAYKSLGAWPLAITSYNHGVGGVRSKINKAGSNNIVDLVETTGEAYFGFASQNFYPEFLAANEVFDNHASYFPEIPVQEPLRVVSVRLKGQTSAAFAAHQLGMSAEQLKEANYALLDAVWAGRAKIPAGYLLRVPVEFQDKVQRLVSGDIEPQSTASERSTSTVYGGTVYKVRKGDSLLSIAKKFKTTVDDLVRQNSLRSKSVVIGQVLTVRSGDSISSNGSDRDTLSVAQSRESSVVKKNTSRTSPAPKKSTASQGRYTVKKGDTLSSISKRTGRSIAAIKKANKLSGSSVGIGKVLIIP